MKRESNYVLAAAIACALSPAGKVFAQGQGLEEILVTAQRREQNKTADPTLYDAFGNTRERGARYGARFMYRFGN